MAELAYDITVGGCRVTAQWSKGADDAVITFYVDDVKYREILFPAYKIWNIAAHFEHDIAPQVVAESLEWGS
jgi:hypothetical protein